MTQTQAWIIGLWLYHGVTDGIHKLKVLMTQLDRT